MNSRYDVCFSGQLQQGQELQAVRQKIQKLFNASPQTLEKLFSGKTQILKRGCDEQTAQKYRQAIERAGALANIRASAVATTQAEPPVASGTQSQTENSGLDLAPAGSDVLRPEERPAVATSEIDVFRYRIDCRRYRPERAYRSHRNRPRYQPLIDG